LRRIKCLWLGCTGFLVAHALIAQQDVGRVLPAETPLHLVAMGDFGTGSPAQIAVAESMARRHAADPFSLGITMGDNFYRCGVHSVHDPKWTTRWENLYSPLGIPFYASLGNHDYGRPHVICPTSAGSPDAEVAYTALSKSWRMPARYYTFAAGAARFVAIDTEGWSPAQLEWVKATLAAARNEPGIQWRIVYGHHPLLTSGVHLNERRISVLVRDLLPVFQATGVDLYISGHDHDNEHLRANGMDFLISGGGGAKLRHFRGRKPESVFTAVRNAFLDVTVDSETLRAQFMDTDLQPLDNPSLVRTKRENLSQAPGQEP